MNRELTELRKVAARLERDTERRNALIRAASEAGASRRRVAAAARLSFARIQQIVSGSVVIVAVALALPVSSAFGSTVAGPDSGQSHPYQKWIDQAQVTTPTATVTIREAQVGIDSPCSESALGCANRGGAWIYLMPDSSAVRFTMLHELGHIADALQFTDELRAQFLTLAGKPALPWIGEGEEVFANTYAACAKFGIKASPEHRSGILNRRGYQAACRFIAAVVN